MITYFIKKIILKNKIATLIWSVIFDVIGVFSFSIPIIGEFSDVIWAPIAAYLMLKMYPSRTGKMASVIVFVEELLPFVDVLPTFTIMSLYNLLFKKTTKPKRT